MKPEKEIKYPEIPEYIKYPIVFEDAKLGIAMIGTWNNEQWVFAVHPAGNWITIRRATSIDPTFITPLNKPETVIDTKHAGTPRYLMLDSLVQELKALPNFADQREMKVWWKLADVCISHAVLAEENALLRKALSADYKRGEGEQ